MEAFWDYAKAFLAGGTLCAIGQILIDKTKLTPARILTAYVVAGVILGAAGIYQPFADWAGAGASVPLTGFGNLLAKGVREAVAKDGVIGIFTGVFGSMMAPKLLHLISVPDDVLPLASLYLRIYFVGIPATVVYNFGAAILRAIGDTKHPLYYLTAAGIVNVVCNVIFVCFCKLDVAGVAIASALSQYLTAFLVLRCLMHKENSCRLSLKMLRLYKREALEMIRIGIPAGLQGTIFSISNVLIQSSINSFGSTVVAGSAAAANLEGFVYVAMNAFYQAALTFTGQNVGAGKLDRVRRIQICCIGSVVVVGALMGGAVYLLGGTLLQLYTSSPEVIAAGMVRLLFIGLPYFICGVMDVMVGMLRGLGTSLVPMCVSVAGVCGVRIMWIFTVFQSLHTPEALYISYPISWLATALTHVLCFEFVYRKFIRSQKPTLAA